MIAYPKFHKSLDSYLENPAARSYLTLGLTLFTLIILIFLAVRPTVLTIFTLQKTLTEQKQVEEKLSKKITALIRANKNYQNLKPVVPLIYDALPQDSKFKEYLILLEKTANESQVTLAGLEFKGIPLSEASAAAKLPEKIDFSLAVEGDYLKIRDFIKSLENLSRLTGVSEVKFSESKDQSSVIANIRATTYYHGK
jgi:Tfp pilus assembly protein PilO